MGALSITAFTAQAGEKGNSARSEAKTHPGKKVANSSARAKPESIEITGTRIPRTARRSNWTTDVELTVTVIDRKQMDRSGDASLADTLRRIPMVR